MRTHTCTHPALHVCKGPRLLVLCVDVCRRLQTETFDSLRPRTRGAEKSDKKKTKNPKKPALTSSIVLPVHPENKSWPACSDSEEAEKGPRDTTT